jgi:hypothetical protein
MHIREGPPERERATAVGYKKERRRWLTDQTAPPKEKCFDTASPMGITRILPSIVVAQSGDEHRAERDINVR